MKHESDRKLKRWTPPLFQLCSHTCTKHSHQRANVELQPGQCMFIWTAGGNRQNMQPSHRKNQTPKYCTTAPKNFILQPWPVDEQIRSLKQSCQRLLLLEVRHKLITALNNLLRPFWNLESAAPSLWRRYTSRAGYQHKVLQISLKDINIRNICTEVQTSSTWKLDVMEMSN